MNENIATIEQAGGGFLHSKTAKLCLCLLVAISLTLLFPMTAHAAEWWDLAGQIDEWLKGMLHDAAEGFFNGYLGFIKSVGADELLSGDFTQLFGANSSQDIWYFINSVHQGLLIPLGESILALVMLVQVVKISQKIDASATLPAVKEIVFLAVFFVIFHWLIVNSVDLCVAVYDEINKITKALLSDQNYNVVISLGSATDMDYGTLIVTLIVAAITWLIGLVAAVVAYIVAAARAIQLYIMAVFSPIPFSLLGFEETRSMGVNFCKNFIGVCLAGTIMVILLMVFPMMMNSLLGSGGSVVDSGAIITGVIVKVLGMPLLLILGLFKSGSWARDLLGG